MPHDPNAAILIFTAAVDIALAVYLVAKNYKSATNISYAVILLCLAEWALSYVFGAMAVDPIWGKFWVNMSFFPCALLPALTLYFAVVFPGADYIRSIWKLFAILLPGAFFGAASFTDFIATSVPPPYIEPEHGSLYTIYVAFIVAYYALALFVIFSKYIKAGEREKLQLLYVAIGAVITIVVGIFMNLYLVTAGVLTIGPFMTNALGPSTALVLAGLTTYSIARHKLLGIDDFFLRGTFFIWGALFIVGSVNVIISGDAQFLVPFNVILAAVSLGFYVLFLNMKNEINRLFCALSLCFAFWMYASLRLAYSSSISSAIYWGKLAFIGPALIPPVFYYFTYVFPRKIKRISLYQMVPMFALPLIIMAFLPTDLLIKSASMTEAHFYPVFGALYNLFLAYFLIYIGYGLADMIIKNNSSVGVEKMQAKYLLTGVILSVIFASITNLALPWFGEHRLMEYGPLFTIIFIGAAAYSISVSRLVSIEFMLQKGLIYLAISTILTLFYVLAGFVSGQSLTILFEYKAMIAVIFFSLFASLIYRPVYRFIQEFSDRLFYGGRYDYQKTLLNVSQGITLVMKLSELIGLIVSTFLDTIKVKEISVLLFDENKGRFKSVPCEIKTAGKYKRIEFDAGGHIASWLSVNKDILVRDEIESEIDKHSFVWSEKGMLSEIQNLRDELEKLGMAVWIPVISKGKLIAIICLGYRQSGDMYTDEDVGLLKILANQVAVAIENSVMYSTISKQYEELKLTKDKLSEADKLASLGTMAAGMAHEIKNPLSSMKVFSQLLNERYEDAEFRKKFVEIIPKEINRIDRIVEGLLSFAKSPELQLSQVGISEVLDEVLVDIKEDIERDGLNIEKKYGTSAAVNADREQLMRVFSNIILNSVQAMQAGGKLGIEVNADKDSKAVTVKISDTGHGISKEHLGHLFDPFFTTKHYGTGLGLTISRSIIDKHKGTIDIQSEPGKGTTVTVTLPVS